MADNKIMTDNKVNRREFILNTTKVIGAGLAITAIPSIFQSCDSEEVVTINNVPPDTFYELDLSPYPELLTPGGVKKVKIEGKNQGNPLIIIHHKDGKFAVLDSICKHMNCAVDAPANSEDTINCQCHPNKYSSVDGTLKEGPFPGFKLTKFIVGKFDPNKKTLEIKI